MTDAVTEKSTPIAGVSLAAPGPQERAGALPSASEQAQAAKDRTLSSAAAIALAQRTLEQVTAPGAVADHVAARTAGERLITHLFDCAMPGYRGWRWAVTLTRPPRGRTATVCEMELLPGEDALLAPAWIPWADRLMPSDVSRSDRLPKRETDERLEPGWEATGEEEGDAVALDELDLGRARVLSPEGVKQAAQRWYDGDHGPNADGVRKAHAPCSTCGFLLRLAGPMRSMFGVCANEWAADDGRVVSLDHGCGAHSETDLPDQGPEWPVTPSRVDEGRMEVIGTDGVTLRNGLTQVELAAQEEQAAEAKSIARKEIAQKEKEKAQATEEEQVGSEPAGGADEPGALEEDVPARDGRLTRTDRVTGAPEDAPARGGAPAAPGESSAPGDASENDPATDAGKGRPAAEPKEPGTAEPAGATEPGEPGTAEPAGAAEPGEPGEPGTAEPEPAELRTAEASPAPVESFAPESSNPEGEGSTGAGVEPGPSEDPSIPGEALTSAAPDEAGLGAPDTADDTAEQSPTAEPRTARATGGPDANGAGAAPPAVVPGAASEEGAQPDPEEERRARAASARDAVADLTAELAARPAPQERPSAPRTLAELEAILPQRD
ncbi:DUF3027 domain-containing protein [Actinomyces oricola]|uniref:DUF3027 domain-containing protein n=1 Tax=Actinomyces oricola TaxID=206043 RepID=UPI001F4FE0DA|nr:DUF3027 domain-containing protein [Actinomyces oricola]